MTQKLKAPTTQHATTENNMILNHIEEKYEIEPRQIIEFLELRLKALYFEDVILFICQQIYMFSYSKHYTDALFK